MPTQESLINIAVPLVAEYLKYLQAHPDGAEHQYRTPFENLINGFHFDGLDIVAIQEDRNKEVEVEGTPDFSVYQDYHTLLSKLVGYIECKRPSYKLEKLVKSEQIKKYSSKCENIILTNYHRFILLQKGKIQHDFELSNDTIIIQKFINLLRDFYGYEYQYIKTKKTLVSALAAQSFYYSVALREYILDKKNQEENFYLRFNGLFKEYQNSINYQYILEDFCDIYSQSLVYGLLLSRLDNEEDLNEKNLDYLKNIPAEYSLLYEFLSRAYESRELPTSIKSALINIGKNINLINVEAIKKEFAQTDNDKDNIAVYLYEDFLASYDKLRGTENRKEGGVYYTPSQAANFITKSVNYLLKTCFDLQHGFSSDNVKVLDFACGTGTFLHSVFEEMITENVDFLQKSTLKQKILNNIYGFELLFTPYIIAHTFLTRFLKEKNIVLDNKQKERLGIYLTNTLDISQHSISEHLPNLKHEYEKSRAIKDNEDILAIIGNPPYFNGKSKANKSVIDKELSKYKTGLDDKKLNLDDIYIKFIRFAEWKINKCGHGVVGIIVNNSWLNGVTHRKMREHLYKTFDEIYVLNLHGDTDRKEPDKNIFDIKRGVCIVFFVKKKKTDKKNKHVYYCSTLQQDLITRKQKLDFLENNTIENINWKEVKPTETENYWFSEKNFSEKKVYEKFWKLTDIFQEWNSANKTERDNITIHYHKDELEKVIDDFKNLSEYELSKKYNTTDSRDWKVSFAKKDIITNVKNKDLFAKIAYRPLDCRVTFFTGKSKGFIGTPSKIGFNHFIDKDNIGLVFKKQLNRNKFNTILVVDAIPDISLLETSHGSAYLAPLYYYNGHKENGIYEFEFADDTVKSDNFSQNFLKNFIQKLSFKPTPEEILAYIYAVLHSKIYREKYIEFLKTDFPAVPMTTNAEIFKKYAKLGQELIDAHLLNVNSNDVEIRANFENTLFENQISCDSFVIEKINYENSSLVLYFVKKENNFRELHISGVTPEIYNFEIGSYKPIEKWLKYRIKDKVTLSLSDLSHLKDMIISIKNTISTMNEIENLGEKYLE